MGYDQSAREAREMAQMEHMQRELMQQQYNQMINSGIGMAAGGLLHSWSGNGSANNSAGTSITDILNAQTQATTALPKENGVLYLKGKELPEDWSGAKITSYKRQMFNADAGFRWHFVFLSRWSDEQRIDLYLDAETLSGEEARKIADTYMEALNQRRSG